MIGEERVEVGEEQNRIMSTGRGVGSTSHSSHCLDRGGGRRRRSGREENLQCGNNDFLLANFSNELGYIGHCVLKGLSIILLCSLQVFSLLSFHFHGPFCRPSARKLCPWGWR